MEGTVMYDEPKQMWFADRFDFCFTKRAIGENNRSWIVGVLPYERERISKKNFRIIPESQYKLAIWAEVHRNLIARKIKSPLDCKPDVLRKIAALIGYEEGSNV